MKKQYIIATVLFSFTAYSQVGVNTETPKTTFDISAKRDAGGNITDNTQPIGLQAPRLTRAELTANTASYGAEQKGALIYITDISGGNNSGQRTYVTTEGYYYFDGLFWQTVGGSGGIPEVDGVIGNEVLNATTNGGLTRGGSGTAVSPYTLGLTSGTTTGQVMTWNGTEWIPTAAANIYNTNGALTSGRTLNINGYNLRFNNTEQSTSWGSTGGIAQNNLQIGTGSSSMQFFGGNNTYLEIQQFYGGSAQIQASNNTTNLTIGTNYTSQPSYLQFATTAGSNTPGIGRMFINSIGNVKVGTNTSATEKLDVDGLVRVRNLPLNGATNAHSTISGDSSSSTQNQTFTATKTLVADANGVVGYVAGLPSSDINIYKDNGSLTNLRTVTLAGNNLRFMGQSQRTEISSAGDLSVIGLPGAVGAAFSVDAPDNDGNGSFASLQTQVFAEAEARIHAVNDTKSLVLGTSGNLTAAPIIFNTAPGGSVSGSERMRITGTGNVGVSTNSPTEKLDNSGITRLRSLPLNGATNAINTNSSGNASASQDQTFTATRTLVADANGVVGYVSGLPANGNGASGTVDIGIGQTTYYVKKVPCTTGRYMSYYYTDVPLIEGLRVDAYMQGGTGPSTVYDPRLINTTSSPIKVNYTAIASGDNAVNRINTTIAAGGYTVLDGSAYVYAGTTYSETETVDLIVNNKWYRILYFAYIDSADNTGSNDTSYRTVRISITRLQ